MKQIRRRSLLRLALGWFGSSWAFLGCARWRRSPMDAGSEKRVQESPERLKQDLETLAQRNYAEEGIPMFLLCENIAPDAKPSHPTTESREAALLSRNLRSVAEAFRRVEPKARGTDLPKLVELLAERDFGALLDGRSDRP